MKIYRSAVVGTGFIGPVHVEALRRLGHQVVGVLGSSLERSQATAEQLGIPKAYSDLSELLADPEVQVVHITSPNQAHFEQCSAAIRAGKHVICEKPLAMTTQQTYELVQLAEAASVVTAVNYNVRFYPLMLEARERRLNGEFGEIFHIVGSYLQDWLFLPTDFNWRVLAEDGGELRAVADIGTHWLDLVCFITGLKVKAVCADLQIAHEQRFRPTGRTETFTGSTGGRGQPQEIINIKTEDAGSVLVRFAGPTRGAFSVSQVMAGRKNCIRFDMAGSRASVSWNSEEPNNLVIGHRTRAVEFLPRDPGLLHTMPRQYADYPGGHAEGFPDTFKQLFRAVYADIEAVDAGHGKNPNPLYATFADGHEEVRICEAILRSHREQRWVTLD